MLNIYTKRKKYNMIQKKKKRYKAYQKIYKINCYQRLMAMY